MSELNNSDIFDAIKKRDYNAVKSYIEQGGDLNCLCFTKKEKDETHYYQCSAMLYFLMGDDVADDKLIVNSDKSRFYQVNALCQATETAWERFLLFSKLRYEQANDFYELLSSHCDPSAEIKRLREDRKTPVGTDTNRGITAIDFLVFIFADVINAKDKWSEADLLYNWIEKLAIKAPQFRADDYLHILINTLDIKVDDIQDNIGFNKKFNYWKDFTKLSKTPADIHLINNREIFDFLPPVDLLRLLISCTKDKNSNKKVRIKTPILDIDGNLSFQQKKYDLEVFYRRSVKKLKESSATDEVYIDSGMCKDGLARNPLNGSGLILSLLSDLFKRRDKLEGIYDDIPGKITELSDHLEKLLSKHSKEHPDETDEEKHLYVKQSLGNSYFYRINTDFFINIVDMYIRHGFLKGLRPRTLSDFLCLQYKENMHKKRLAYLLDRGIIDANLNVSHDKDPDNIPYIFITLAPFCIINEARVTSSTPSSAPNEQQVIKIIKERINLFLSYGLDINIRSSEGKSLAEVLTENLQRLSSIQMVFRINYPEAYELLYFLHEKGFDFSKKNQNGFDYFDNCKVTCYKLDTLEEFKGTRLKRNYGPFFKAAKAIEKAAKRKALNDVKQDDYIEYSYEW